MRAVREGGGRGKPDSHGADPGQRVDNMGYGDRDRRGGGFGGPREMHKATCADCKKECEVPFKPTEGRPVYCRDCFQKHRPPRSY
jgi:CxxC-x17-CxxC domain-containing protein